MSARGAAAGFRVEAVDYATGRAALHAVRETVFVVEQAVPPDLETDALDPLSFHVLARDNAGRPIGAGRLTPERRIGRMAVLKEWRGRGVGEALLAALIEEARRRHWAEVTLNAQTHALAFYARGGFVPFGPCFLEAGIEHQAMRRRLQGATPVTDARAAVAAALALIARTRRSLCCYSRRLDPGLLDDPAVLHALRRLATVPVPGGRRLHFLLQDASVPQRGGAPLLPLAQRLPSVFAFREIRDPVDRDYPSAYLANDAGDLYFRPLGHRFDGEVRLGAPGHARPLLREFAEVWERARPCTEYRALAL